MKLETQKHLLRITIAGIIVVISWLLLHAIGDNLVDQKAILTWLTENKWLKFINLEIRYSLVDNGWQLLVAFAFGIISYRYVKHPADYLISRYIVEESEMQIRWEPSFDELPQPEFIYILPENSHSCGLLLEKRGPGPERICRIELAAGINRYYNNADMIVAEPSLILESDRNEIGQEWTLTSENLWVIDRPFIMQEGDIIHLPQLNLTTNESLDDMVFRINKLVGLSTLEIIFEIVITTDKRIIPFSLSAPLRILQPLDEDEEDDGINALVAKLDIANLTAKESLRDVYQNIRQLDYSVRTQILDKINALQEIKSLESVEEELYPYDQEIESRPTDPKAHYARGHVLTEMGLYQEALNSLNQAVTLGLDDSVLHIDRAKTILALSRPEEALEVVQNVISTEPKNVDACIIEGDCLIQLERYTESMECYNRALDQITTNADLHYRLGTALICLELNEKALLSFDSALELDPHSAKSYVGRATALIGQNRNHELIAALEHALQLGYQPDDLAYFETLLDKETRAQYRQLIGTYQAEKDC